MISTITILYLLIFISYIMHVKYNTYTRNDIFWEIDSMCNILLNYKEKIIPK